MRKILYLGTSPEGWASKGELIHYPVISLVPKSSRDEKFQGCLKRLSLFSHCLWTSKNAVSIFWDLCGQLLFDPAPFLQGKCLSIGSATSRALRDRGVEPFWQAFESTQEGMSCFFDEKLPDPLHVFYPRSSAARLFLARVLLDRNIAVEVLDLYDPVCQAPEPRPVLEEMTEIVFTSPSTVDAFFQIFSAIPPQVRISFQGPVTKRFFCEKYKSLLINFKKKI